MIPLYGTTKDGFEMQFGVNYLAKFMLMKLLFPKVKLAGAESSVIIVASSAVRSGNVEFGDVGFSEGRAYDALVAYAQSNAARVMFVKALAEKLGDQGIRTFSIDPGGMCSPRHAVGEKVDLPLAVRSGMQRHFSPKFQEMVTRVRDSGGLVNLHGKHIELPSWTTKSEGAATIITGMIDPTIQDHNWAFLHKIAVADEELHSHILGQNNWAKLWELSEQIIRESFAV